MGIDRFDYVIVGGGSAGCVLANRLSADGSKTVLLLEAGPRDWDPLIHIPLGIGKMHDLRLHDWHYDTEPDPALGGREIAALRGKVLGGSHAINVMAHTRGHRGDYDRWTGEGAPGWGFDDLLPYFKRTETWTEGANEMRGGAGPVHVEWARSKDPVFDAWLQAGGEVGFPTGTEFNSGDNEGFGRVQFTIRNGRRHSAATAYLRPAMKRKNLKVVTNAHATQIVIEDKRATGIRYLKDRTEHVTMASQEVILSAGAFNTPQLLLLSGIGPGDHLREIGVAPRIDLPVGNNLQDHLAAWFTWHRKEPGPFHHLMRFDRIAWAMMRAYFIGTGPATVLPTTLFAFVKSDPSLNVPDIEFMFKATPAKPRMWFPGIRAAAPDTIAIRPTLLLPKSRGTVRLRSSDPFAAPRIDYNFLTAPEDLQRILKGTRMALDVASQAPLAPYRGELVAPKSCTTDDEIEGWFRKTAMTANHPCGTCAMGQVVGTDLRVLGMQGLRVVDASVMPSIISGHINACVLMIAERASEMIIGRRTI